MDKKKKIIIIGVVGLIIVSIIIAVIVININNSSKTKYTLKYMVDNKEYTSQVVGNSLDSINIPAPKKEGYKFLGWYVNGKLFNTDMKISEDIVLESKWQKIKEEINVEEENNIEEENNNEESGDNLQNDNVYVEEAPTNNTPASNNTNNNSPQNQIDNRTYVKETTETESIGFDSISENEVNMLRGTTKVIQNGVNGVKTIKYKITYNSSNIEISREKISEKITTQPIKQITKVGISDFNMNTDTYNNFGRGYYCPENKLINNGNNSMPDCTDGFAGSYARLHLSTGNYVYKIGTEVLMPIDESKMETTLIKIDETSSELLFIGIYNGEKYYFTDMLGAGGPPELLNEDYCTKYGLSCGRW